jgi:hypothetical protein
MCMNRLDLLRKRREQRRNDAALKDVKASCSRRSAYEYEARSKEEMGQQ